MMGEVKGIASWQKGRDGLSFARAGRFAVSSCRRFAPPRDDRANRLVRYRARPVVPGTEPSSRGRDIDGYPCSGRRSFAPAVFHIPFAPGESIARRWPSRRGTARAARASRPSLVLGVSRCFLLETVGDVHVGAIIPCPDKAGRRGHQGRYAGDSRSRRIILSFHTVGLCRANIARSSAALSPRSGGAER